VTADLLRAPPLGQSPSSGCWAPTVVYREAEVDVSASGVVLRPSLTHVPLKGTREFRVMLRPYAASKTGPKT
jgi:hypothetical protein